MVNLTGNRTGVLLLANAFLAACVSLGDNNFLMLHNHGLLTCGSTIADTFLMMFTFQRACDIQVLAQNGGAELIPIGPQILAGAKAMVAAVTKSAQGMGGALAWPALLRKLDSIDPGYKT